jgi:hypothetical protein
MSKKLLGRSGRKRNWGRSTRIDSWERLRLVIELIESSLPVDVSIDLNDAEVQTDLPQPLPYNPHTKNSMPVPTRSPTLAEVRVSLCINETLALLLPVHFCIDQLLTAEEVVTKVADAFWFLQGWSQVHSHEATEQLRIRRLQTQPPVKSPRLMVQ